MIAEGLEDDRALGRAHGAVADQDRAGLRHGLEPTGSVHQVADNHAFIDRADGDGGLAGQHAGTSLDALRQAGDSVDQVEGCPYGALRIIFLRGWRSLDGHDRVADELLDGAAVALDDLPGGIEVEAQRFADILCVA